jgi:excisionase family DNA binding protein
LVGYADRDPALFEVGMPKLSDYVLTAEAADILGVSENTVRAWATQGKLPVRRNPANGYRLFLRSDLQTFLDKIAKPTATRRKPK